MLTDTSHYSNALDTHDTWSMQQMQGVNGMPMPNNMMESEMIGAIKIKDGLFIGDEYASGVGIQTLLLTFPV